MKYFNKRVLVCLIIILFFGLFGVKALLKPGYYTSHDGWHQVVRLYYFHESLKEKIIPPQFVNNLYYGYGYSLYIFSYHLPWIFAEPFMLSGFDVFDSIKAVYFVGFIVSGITMFIFLKNRFGNLESVTGSLLYMWAPYRFSNIFVRGAMGEATIFIFLPLVFLAIDKCVDKFNKKYLLLGAFSVASIILSHAMTAVLIFGMTAIYIVISIFFAKKKVKSLISVSLIVFLGVLIASYYLIPSITLKQYTKFDELIKATRFDGQSVNLKDLIYSPWGYGFASPRLPDSMSFQVGIAQWLVFILIIFSVSLRVILRKTIKHPAFLSGLLLIFIVSLVLILPVSEDFWRYTSDKVFHIDFPWRLLAIVVFSLSALSSYLIWLIKPKIKLLLVILLVAVSLYTNRNHLRVNEYTHIPLELYLLSEDTTNTYDEYLPKWSDSSFLEKAKLGGQIISSKDIGLDKITKTINTLSFNYTSEVPSEIKINILYFPGWQLTVSGKNQEIKPAEGGVISFAAPSGNHSVMLRYKGTQIAIISQIITTISLLFILVFTAKYLVKL